MAIYLAGVVNPNGLEIAGAFCLWLAALDLLACADRPARGPPASSRGWWSPPSWWPRCGPCPRRSSGSSSSSSRWRRSTRANLRVLWSDGRIRAGLAVLVVAVAVSVIYVVANRSYDAVIGYTFADDPSRLELAHRSWARTWSRLSQMIGVFGSLDAPLPSAVVTVWVAAAGALGVLAVVRRPVA